MWSEPVLHNVIFAMNRADYGGGAYFWNAPSPVGNQASCTNCAVPVSYRPDDLPHTGTPNNISGGPVLNNVAFEKNVGRYGGGAFFIESRPLMVNALGSETTLEIPAESEPTPLVAARAPQAADAKSLRTSYAILLTTTLAADRSLTMMDGHGLRLEANRSLATAGSLTVAYDDGDIDGLREDTLGLYAWDGRRWLDAEPCGGYVRDEDNNLLQAVICELGDYAILGKNQWVVQLPLVLRNVP